MNTEEFLEQQKRIMIDAINETTNKSATEGLRDYFAAAALQGFCSGPEYGLAENKAAGLTWIDVTTSYAYKIADAMLKERERGG